jgi:hypothetical protein
MYPAKRQIRLLLSNVRPHTRDYSLIGAADSGCAIDRRNSVLADDLAAALRRAGYTGAWLWLDGAEVDGKPADPSSRMWSIDDDA